MADTNKRSFSDAGEEAEPKKKRSRWQDEGPQDQPAASGTEAQDKLKALQAQIQAQMSNVKNMLEAKKKGGAAPAAAPAGVPKMHSGPGPAPVIMDRQGRDVGGFQRDDVATLLINQAPVKAAPKEVLPMLETDPTRNKFFDPNMKAPTGRRERRAGFKFVDDGTFRKAGEALRSKRSRQAQTSRYGQTQSTVGGTAFLAAEKERVAAVAAAAASGEKVEASENKAAPAAPVVPFKKEDPIPDMEWWDAMLEPDYTDPHNIAFNKVKITHLVEHPIPMEPVTEAPETGPVALPLTRKEQKKIRTRTRIETEKEKQAQIRMGLLPPPPPKVKISNMMKALLNEAVQDPSKIEQQVREEMAQRQKNHDLRNAERKLTPEERRQKKLKKYADEVSIETQVALFRVEDFSNPQHRYKVDINASQLHLTGAVVICDESKTNAVVVEGGQRGVKKFAKLLLSRIKWGSAEGEVAEENAEDGEANKGCTLIWQGVVKKNGFKNFHLEECRTEGLARKFLHDKGVEHYWDMCKKAQIEAQQA